MSKPIRAKAIKPTLKPHKLLKGKFYGAMTLGIITAVFYFLAFASNLSIRSDKFYLVIKPHTTIDALADSMVSAGILKYKFSFIWVAKAMQFQVPKSGLYTLHRGWGNVRLVANLAHTAPQKYRYLTVKTFRNRSNVIRHICKETNLDFKAFYETLNDVTHLKTLGLNKESVFVIFLPTKYAIPINTTTIEIIEILKASFDQYWNADRTELIGEAKLDPIQATILSSIVFAETKTLFEMPIIAGVYINRLQRGMRLESDPTLVFAQGDFSLKRIYNKHTQSTSGYNTYRKKGLPPGPIGSLNWAAMDAVINYTEHDYIFFCAHENLGGTHIYSETYHEHKRNAGRYRSAINKRKIK